MIDPHIFGILEGALKVCAALLGLAVAWLAWKTRAHDAPTVTAEPKRKLLSVFIAIICIAVAIFAVWLLFFKPSGDALSRFLAKRDPAVFFGSSKNNYSVARVILDRSDLETNTKLAKTIDDTEITFDLLAIGGGVFQLFQSNFERAVERGVRVRILLEDPGLATKGFYDTLFGTPRDSSPAAERSQALATLKAVQNLSVKIVANRDRFKGYLELRWLQKPLLYSVWLKDAANSHRAVAHLSLFSYRGSSWDPSFRMGQDSLDLISGLREEFETLWENSGPSIGQTAAVPVPFTNTSTTASTIVIKFQLLQATPRQTTAGTGVASRKVIENLLNDSVAKVISSSGLKNDSYGTIVATIRNGGGGYANNVSLKDTNLDDKQIDSVSKIIKGSIFPEPMGSTDSEYLIVARFDTRP
jgi:hypothetical protein